VAACLGRPTSRMALLDFYTSEKPEDKGAVTLVQYATSPETCSRRSSCLFSADNLRARTVPISACKAQSSSMDIGSRSSGAISDPKTKVCRVVDLITGMQCARVLANRAGHPEKLNLLPRNRWRRQDCRPCGLSDLPCLAEGPPCDSHDHRP
jgi:hypothetical protein